jgi:CBS domain-containing protein
LLSDKIRTLDLPPPLTVESGTSVRQVIETVQRRSAGCVLVVRDDRVIGIMTERDVLMKVVARDVSHDDPVDNFMTKEPFSLAPDDTIAEAITLMNREGFRNVPIVDATSGKAIAIFRVQDVVNYLAESFPEQVLNLPPRPHQLMKTQDGG